jgi:HEAT repeat protein
LRLSSSLIVALLTALLVAAVPVAARAGQDPDGAALARGWQAYAAGDFSRAVEVADGMLRRAPADHHAVALKIEAQCRLGDPDGGLTAYETWLPVARREDPHLLQSIATGVLRQLGQSADAGLRAEALATLAARGDAVAMAGLAGTSDEAAGLQEEIALARAGHAQSAQRLADRLGGGQVPEPGGLIAALAEAGRPEAAPAILPYLDDERAFVRAAAARAVGALGHREAAAGLSAALEDPHPMVRMSAAVSLARLGERGADELLSQMLVSDVPDVRLAAAEAYAGETTGPWVTAVTPLLRHDDPMVRLQAARLLADIDPEAAGEAIRGVLDDPNPALRTEASRAAAHVLPADLASLRRLLRDREPWVRLHAARALLES